MSAYCDRHRRRFIGEGCPWCRDESAEALSQAAANIDVAANAAANANVPASYARWRIRDVEKRRTYMRDFMRRQPAGQS
jgi:hypothetical protein